MTLDIGPEIIDYISLDQLTLVDLKSSFEEAIRLNAKCSIIDYDDSTHLIIYTYDKVATNEQLVGELVKEYMPFYPGNDEKDLT